MRWLGLLALATLVACTSGAASDDTSSTSATDPSTTATEASPPTTRGSPTTYPPAPESPQGALDPITEQGLELLLDSVLRNDFEAEHLDTVVEGGDVRAAWLLTDLLRFYQGGDSRDALVSAFRRLTDVGLSASEGVDFVWASNTLIAWDLPAWNGYSDMKGDLFSALDERWAPFFEEDHGVDWRLVTWGGVLPDDRPLGDNGPCNCIPSLDNPETTDAEGGDWYEDDRIVFGVVVNGEALALPKHQMEVHELVNTTLGERDIGVPYCTLCGSAQAYFTDDVADFERLVLRTSGLLSRSNKLMYDLTTGSAIDTFTGEALSGPLAEARVVLEQTTVVAARWGDWKETHPGTQILAEDGGIDRLYADDPLRGRDDAGPIFPVGDVDPRLPIQENVVGVISPQGQPIAFPVGEVMEIYPNGGEFEHEGLTVRVQAGIRVFDDGGQELPTHQAFWFAWSQFHPGTELWSPDS